MYYVLLSTFQVPWRSYVGNGGINMNYSLAQTITLCHNHRSLNTTPLFSREYSKTLGNHPRFVGKPWLDTKLDAWSVPRTFLLAPGARLGLVWQTHEKCGQTSGRPLRGQGHSWSTTGQEFKECFQSMIFS